MAKNSASVVRDLLSIVISQIYGLEGWSNIKEKELSKLELLQTRPLKSILKLSESTPNSGLLMETGI